MGGEYDFAVSHFCLEQKIRGSQAVVEGEQYGKKQYGTCERRDKPAQRRERR